MTRPTFTLLLTTIGRPTLARTLASIRAQDLRPGDEVLVVADGRSPAALKMFEQAQLPGRVMELPSGPHGDWGHSARNLTMHLCIDRTSHIHHIDDDDSYLPGALAMIRERVQRNPDRPHLFRMSNSRSKNWPPGNHLRVGLLGTPMIVHPARWGAYGVWRPQYGGDGWFIVETCGLIPGGPVWHPESVVAVRN